MPDTLENKTNQFSDKEKESMRQAILRWIGELPMIKKKNATINKPTQLLAPINEPLLPDHFPRQRHWFLWIYRGLWVVFGFIILGAAISVYGFNRHNALTDYVPLPYAFVRYHPIWVSTYRSDAALIVSQSDISEDEIQRLILRRNVANDLAWSRGLWVTQKETDKAFNDLIKEAGSIDEMEQTLETLWQMTPTQYSERILKPYLLKIKLLNLLAIDPANSHIFGASPTLQNLDQYLDSLIKETSFWVIKTL